MRSRWAGPALALLVALALAGAAGAAEECPAGCACGDGVELHAECAAAGLTLQGRPGSYVNLYCEEAAGAGLSCDGMPRMDFGRNATLPSLGVHYCALAGVRVRCVLAALGARGVRALTLAASRGAVHVDPALVAGLQGLQQLYIIGTDEQTVSISREALALLPELTRLVVQGAQLQLDADVFRGSNLTSLELGGAGLRALPDAALAPLATLTQLLLYRNDIHNVTERTFEGLSALQLLDLSGNRLRALPPAALAALANLTNLTLSLNPLDELPTLGALAQLLEVNVLDNLSPLALPARALAGLPRLASVTLQRCGVRALPPDLLAGSRELRRLDLARNTLAALPRGLLRDQHRLAALDLSGNWLRVLDDDVFASLEMLEDLRLDGNQLVELPDGLLGTLGSLTSLSARDNQLRALSAAAFRGAARLARLDLAGNQLAFGDHQDQTDQPDQQTEYRRLSPAASPFSELTRLQHLDLSRNHVADMFTDLPLLLVELRTLDLAHNHIELIDAEYNNELNFFSDAVQVDVRHNRVARVYLRPARSPTPPTGDAVAAAPRTARLLLDDNPLVCDCLLFPLARRLHGAAPPPFLPEPRMDADQALCAAPPELNGTRVRDVPLRDFTCDLTDDATQCPAGCSCAVRPDTQALELLCPEAPEHVSDDSGLRVELRVLAAPPVLAALPPAVRALSLAGLGLAAAPLGPAPPSLAELDLSNNSLAAIPAHLLAGNLTLRLAGNPLACDCWHARDVAALQARAESVSDYGALTCADGTALGSVNSAQLCVTWSASLAGGLLALVGVLAAAGAALLYRYSLEARVLLYSRGCCVRWLRRREALLDRDKTYDAFVSFAHEDTAFVLEHLLPALEGGPRPFRLCVHCRDWVAGEWIPAQIARSVDQSRRTIVVLSRRFLDSIWGRLEFRAAHMAAVSEARSRVIVVLLEDVEPHPELDAELRAYLATNTYLRWGERWFWDKLRYALPHREEEARALSGGRELMRRVVGGGGGGGKVGGGLDARLTPDGKIVNAAVKAAPE